MTELIEYMLTSILRLITGEIYEPVFAVVFAVGIFGLFKRFMGYRYSRSAGTGRSRNL